MRIFWKDWRLSRTNKSNANYPVIMHSLVYKSTAHPNLTGEDLSKILETARNFNEENAISGCLIYYNHKFLQILEGDKRRVGELFFRITQDKRNFDVILMYEGFIKERTFKKWSMAHIDLDAPKNNSLEHELFKTNLMVYSTLAERSGPASVLFWSEARAYLQENDF